MSVKGLLLVNLGSPEAPTPAAVGKYLRQFLMDKYVIDIPYLARLALVYGVIVPIRSAKSAHAYQKIWRVEGSPLLHFTRDFAEGVRAQLKGKWDVRWAMRYGEPSISEVIRDWAVDEVYLVPLYPQYAESSSRTAIDESVRILKRIGSKQKLFVMRDFYSEPEFIESQAQQIVESLKTFKADHLLLSFHGLPEHHLYKLHPETCRFSGACCDSIHAGNRFCYRAQSMATARALSARVSLPPERISVGFQSRLGRRPWIKPYTDEWIDEVAAKGSQRVLVSCPSFVADCLETLEEVEIRLRDQFLSRGGEALSLVPALNSEKMWIEQFSKMVERIRFEQESL